MIKNYFIVTLRNLFKNRVYALINILGLGLALAICIVAYFNHMFAYEFDRSHENFDEIYRINSSMPVILYSGFSDPSDAEEIKNSGIREMLMKPIDKKKLAQVVRRVLDENL